MNGLKQLWAEIDIRGGGGVGGWRGGGGGGGWGAGGGLNKNQYINLSSS